MNTNLKEFISEGQLNAINSAIGKYGQGEEANYFLEVYSKLAELINTMPKTYEQDGLGDQAIVYLHYFKGGMDWYITERDIEEDQLQAFGLADLGYGGELGYISVKELIENGVELDLHFDPTTLAAVRKSK